VGATADYGRGRSISRQDVVGEDSIVNLSQRSEIAHHRTDGGDHDHNVLRPKLASGKNSRSSGVADALNMIDQGKGLRLVQTKKRKRCAWNKRKGRKIEGMSTAGIS